MKRAIVIGATSGIGRALAERLAAEGYRVGVTGRREALLEELAASRPGSFCYAAADIMDPAAACAALERLAGELGGMDLCVVSAGTGDLNPGLDYALEEPAIRTNVVGWTAAVDWAYGRFEERGGGHLVVISSVGGLRGSGAAPAYNASKAYQINYAEGLRQRVAKSGLPVTITDIRPGLVDTAMAKGEGLFWVQPVAKTVRQILRAVERRRHVAVVTRRWRIAAWLLRHLPESLYLKM
jgi:short-subunit dehydrogenase